MTNVAADYSGLKRNDVEVKQWLNELLSQTGVAADMHSASTAGGLGGGKGVLPSSSSALDNSLTNVVTELQAMSAEMNEDIERGMEEVMATLPRSVSALDRVESSVKSLHGELEDLTSQLERIDTGSNAHVELLAKLDVVKLNMKHCMSTLSEAASWSKLVREVQHQFAADDLTGVAEHLEAMRHSMDVLKDMPEADERSATLLSLQSQLEALLKPKLLEALSKERVSSIADFVVLYKKLGKLGALQEEYTRARPAAVHKLWFAYTPRSDSNPHNAGFKEWLHNFFEHVESMVLEERRRAAEIFGEQQAPELLCQVLLQTFQPLLQTFQQRLESGESVTSVSWPEAVSLLTSTLAFMGLVLEQVRGADASTRLAVLLTVTSPFQFLQDAYFERERAYLKKQLATPLQTLQTPPTLPGGPNSTPPTDPHSAFLPRLEQIMEVQASGGAFDAAREALERCIELTAGYQGRALIRVLGDVMGTYVQSLLAACRGTRYLAGIGDSQASCSSLDGSMNSSVDPPSAATATAAGVIGAVAGGVPPSAPGRSGVTGGEERQGGVDLADDLDEAIFGGRDGGGRSQGEEEGQGQGQPHAHGHSHGHGHGHGHNFDWQFLQGALQLLKLAGWCVSDFDDLEKAVASTLGQTRLPLFEPPPRALELALSPPSATPDSVVVTRLRNALAVLRLEEDRPGRTDLRSTLTTLSDSVLMGDVLSATGREVTALASEARHTVFDLCFGLVRRTLLQVPSLSCWGEEEGEEEERPAYQDYGSSDVLPQEYMTQVGEHLLSLLQQLEPFAASDAVDHAARIIDGTSAASLGGAVWRSHLGSALSLTDADGPALRALAEGTGIGTARLRAGGGGGEEEEEEEEDENDNNEGVEGEEEEGGVDARDTAAAAFCNAWLEAVGTGTVGLLLASALRVPRFSKMGAARLHADSSYLLNVFHALDLPAHPLLRHLNALMGMSKVDMLAVVHAQSDDPLRAVSPTAAAAAAAAAVSPSAAMGPSGREGPAALLADIERRLAIARGFLSVT